MWVWKCDMRRAFPHDQLSGVEKWKENKVINTNWNKTLIENKATMASKRFSSIKTSSFVKNSISKRFSINFFF